MKSCSRCVWLGKQKKAHFHICLNPDSKFHNLPFPHGKVRKACRLYESRDFSPIPQITPEGMRLIEDLRGKEEFRDSDFWVIGSDSNLDYYPDDFFDDKFSIAVNLSCVAFPESTFLYMSGREELEWMISKHPDCLRRVILLLYYVQPKLSPKAERRIQARLLPYKGTTGRWEDWGLEPIYMRPEDKLMTESVPDYESTAKRIFSGGLCNFVLVRTSAHLAIFAAATLGAKKIILVGCSHKLSEGKVYARKRGMGNFISELAERRQKDLHYGTQSSAIARLRRDTKQLAGVFGKYGVEIVRHRFDEGRNEFIFEKI